MNTDTHIYVLKLSDDKYCIGSTNDPTTLADMPIDIFTGDRLDEVICTIGYIRDFGHDNVSGEVFHSLPLATQVLFDEPAPLENILPEVKSCNYSQGCIAASIVVVCLLIVCIFLGSAAYMWR